MDSLGVVGLLVVLGLLTVAHAALWVTLVQVVQQQGRILLRLDGLADNMRGVHPWPADQLPVIDAPVQPPGLPVGSLVGDFLLPDLAGRQIGPGMWQGQRTLLVHWNITCGFCELIAPDLARLQADLGRQRVRLVLASYGDATSNRDMAEEYGLTCPILLQPDSQPVAAFSHLGTPVAYVLDEAGRVAEPLVLGADSVLDLARRLASRPDDHRPGRLGARPLSESHIERNGLRAGTLAPSFALPDVRGGTVALESYRGRRLLLVFTDPHCEPCDALAPELARLARAGSDGGLSVLVIGRGDAQENRRKAEKYEFTFPVVVQKRWEVSKAYGIFMTPVGYLIDERGVILQDVAMGRDAIVALAKEGLAVSTRKELGNGRAV